MISLTLENLKQLMQSCGVDEGTDLNGDIAESSFEELGYDSLALLDIIAQIENEYDLKLSEEDLDKMQTPGQLIDFVNNMLIGAR